MITFADFEKVDVRVGRVIRADEFPEARAVFERNREPLATVLLTQGNERPTPGQIRTLGVRQASASTRIGEQHWVNALYLKTRDSTGDLAFSGAGFERTGLPVCDLPITLAGGAGLGDVVAAGSEEVRDQQLVRRELVLDGRPEPH